jgi:hypothetical protein
MAPGARDDPAEEAAPSTAYQANDQPGAPSAEPLAFDNTMSIDSTLSLLESLFPVEFSDWSVQTIDGNTTFLDPFDTADQNPPWA